MVARPRLQQGYARRTASARAPARRCDSLCAAWHPGHPQPARHHERRSWTACSNSRDSRKRSSTMATCRALARRSTSRGWRQRCSSSRRRASTISIAVTSRGRSSRDLAACGSPRDCGGPAQPPRWLAQAIVDRALARHAVQPAAADAGRGIADDPRHSRSTGNRAHATRQRRLRALVRRGGEAGVRRARPVHHRPGVHDARCTGLAVAGLHRRAGGAGRPDARRAVGRGADARRIRSGWA